MSDKNREKILASARGLLLKHGPTGITMEDTAVNAECTRKTVYNHFQSRAILLDEVMTRIAHESLQELQAVVEEEERPFPDKLNDIIKKGFTWMHTWDRMFPRPGIYRQAVAGSDTTINLREHLRGFIERIVGEAMDLNLIDASIPARRLPWIFINMVEGLISIEDMDDEPFTKLDLMRDSLRVLVAGILNEKGREVLKESLLFTDTANE